MNNSRLILLAEDEETEAMIFKIAWRKAGLQHALVIVRDGLEAVEFLEKALPQGASAFPSLIILDLKMPRMSGFDVLSWLAEQPTLKSTPAVVLSSSSYPQDMHKARQLGAKDYKVKPHTIEELGAILREFDQRWISVGALEQPDSEPLNCPTPTR